VLLPPLALAALALVLVPPLVLVLVLVPPDTFEGQ
jgi:hypothetical protein